jgi:hypothetical protein
MVVHSHRAGTAAASPRWPDRPLKIDELVMIAILLILFIILLFAALPTWPYSASGRARYHVVSARERISGAAKPPQSSGGKALHTMTEDHASRLRELQNELQEALDRTAKGSLEIAKPSEADRSSDSREQQAA